MPGMRGIPGGIYPGVYARYTLVAILPPGIYPTYTPWVHPVCTLSGMVNVPVVALSAVTRPWAQTGRKAWV